MKAGWRRVRREDWARSSKIDGREEELERREGSIAQSDLSKRRGEGGGNRGGGHVSADGVARTKEVWMYRLRPVDLTDVGKTLFVWIDRS